MKRLFFCVYRASTLCFFLLASCSFSNAQQRDTIFVKNPSVKSNLSEVINKAPNNAVVLLEAGLYLIDQLKITKPIKLIGRPGTKLAPTKGSLLNALIIANQPLEMDNVTIDGEGRVFWGIYSTSDLVVSNLHVMRFHGNEKAPGNGIRHIANNKRLVVKNSIIESISSFEDGKVGNYIGATRGILTSGGNVTIEGSKFREILGDEDGDCIHIQTEPDSKDEWRSAGKVIIESCFFESFGKRAIKIQASDVVARNNKISSKNKKIYSAISVYGSRNVIDNNEIDVSNSTAALTIISGRKNRIRNNIVFVDREENNRLTWGVAFDKAIGTELTGNTFITNGKRSPFSFSKTLSSREKQRMQTQNNIRTQR